MLSVGMLICSVTKDSANVDYWCLCIGIVHSITDESVRVMWKLQISTFFHIPVPPIVRVSLAEDNVIITEGDNGTFCVVIEDPAVVVDGIISVTLHTMEGTAEGVAI